MLELELHNKCDEESTPPIHFSEMHEHVKIRQLLTDQKFEPLTFHGVILFVGFVGCVVVCVARGGELIVYYFHSYIHV